MLLKELQPEYIIFAFGGCCGSRLRGTVLIRGSKIGGARNSSDPLAIIQTAVIEDLNMNSG